MAKLCVVLCLCLGVEYGLCQFGLLQQIGDTTNQLGQNIVRSPKRLRDRLVGLFRPHQRNTDNREVVFPIIQRPIVNDRPNYANGQTNQNNNNYNDNSNYDPYYERNKGNPIVFPTSRPQEYPDPQNSRYPNTQLNPIPQYNNEYQTNSPTDYVNSGNNPAQNSPKDQENYQSTTENTNRAELTTEINIGNAQNINQGASNNNYGADNTAENNDYQEKPGKAIGTSTINSLDSDVANVIPSTSTLPPLTPVPAAEGRANDNFGARGVFTKTCDTPDGQVGSCISLYQCPPYLQIVKDNRSSPAAVQLLRKAHCGFDGNIPKVCCPRQGFPTAPPTEPPTSTTTTTTTTTEAAPAGKNLDTDFIPAMLEPPVCGHSNASFSRVVGGVNAKLGDFPWVALLGYMDRRRQSVRWQCGGSLISSRHVLTAAHCIHGHEDALYLVRLGELDLAKEDDGATPVDVLIKRKVKHEEYNANTHINDVGILVLDRDVQFTHLIRPICMPMDSKLRENTYENYNPIIAGWGDTTYRGTPATHLQALQLPVLSNSYCSSAYAKYKAQIDDMVLCAGYKQGGKDACQGDSGGPLMQPIWDSKEFTSYFYQIGIVSYGRQCAAAGSPGVYARVTHYVPWIQEKLLGV